MQEKEANLTHLKFGGKNAKSNNNTKKHTNVIFLLYLYGNFSLDAMAYRKVGGKIDERIRGSSFI